VTYVHLAGLVAATLIVTAACSSDESGASNDGGAAETVGGAGGESGGANAVGGAGGAGGAPGSVCLPEGVFGKCSDNPGCQCLLGATVYQFCTADCQTSAECGDAASTPGAAPGCFPINPGSPQQICALICEDTADCPCGLTCMLAGVPGSDIKLCAELQ
jgi:hypothetical protein